MQVATWGLDDKNTVRVKKLLTGVIDFDRLPAKNIFLLSVIESKNWIIYVPSPTFDYRWISTDAGHEMKNSKHALHSEFFIRK